jgi:hypothetical protein
MLLINMMSGREMSDDKRTNVVANLAGGARLFHQRTDLGVPI